jgi:hypothetical protein
VSKGAYDFVLPQHRRIVLVERKEVGIEMGMDYQLTDKQEGKELDKLISKIIQENNHSTAVAKIMSLVEEHYSRPADEWVRCEDAIPAKEGNYICKTGYSDTPEVRTFSGGGFYNHDGYAVTHWKLPQPPKQ